MLQPHTVDSAGSPRRERVRVEIEGIVQGVGFRPFVHARAARHGIDGFVANDGRGVIVEAEADHETLARFVEELCASAPPAAVVERVSCRSLAASGETGFAILASDACGEHTAPVAADLATCEACLDEIRDPTARRHRYAFTNCTACGPRFTIVRGVPYDRSRTTMAPFATCGDCAREYADPEDRRFHAEPISCPACGPRLRLLDAGGEAIGGDPLDEAAMRLRRGEIVAIKGLGGYHLAVVASDEAAVARLRARKHREEKPFAVMAADLASASALAEIDAAEAALLAGARRPIVLLRRRTDAPVAPSVAPRNRTLGIFLPYTPLHHLLAAAVGEPFVLTSGNASDEPIAFTDDDARCRLAGIADAFLVHDREIEVRADDSVVRVSRGREMPIRRSRGYAPQPLSLPCAARRPILACGAELKSTFCLAKGDRAFLSHHIGDLENFQTLRSFREGIAHFARLFDVTPEVVVHDLHPDYLSTKVALEIDVAERIGVQHHHAHVAACLADNGEVGPAIGVAFDGTGYGLDGTIWGGEVLVADLLDAERVAYFEPVALPGGAQAIRQPWRMAASHLRALGLDAKDLEVARRNLAHWDAVLAVARSPRLSPRTSSVGRLFDAVAALAGIRDEVRFEAQAAIELEQCADLAETGAYDAQVSPSFPHLIRGADFIAAVVDDLRHGAAPATISARFHNGLVRLVARVCAIVRERSGLATVALSGGVFQNALLLERTVAALEAAGFGVLTHSRVPPNDGGISFGQAAIAAMRGAADRH